MFRDRVLAATGFCDQGDPGSAANDGAEFLHPLFDSGPDQPPIHRITGKESANHCDLHSGPKFDAIDWRLMPESVS